MRWVAIFTDTPAMLSVRAQWAAAHLDYLARHLDEIVLAGGCRDDEGGDYIGGCVGAGSKQPRAGCDLD